MTGFVVGAAVGVVVGVVAILGVAVILIRRQDRRWAQRVHYLRTQTPLHTSNGGPTTYDDRGRVRY